MTRRSSTPDTETLLARWHRLDLPEQVGRALLERWSEPHRRYHDTSHLRVGLVVLDRFEAPPLVETAWWFHDAVHHNDTPTDEQASAALARHLLAATLGDDDIDEVVRLVLLTIDHRPESDDLAGALICDADLQALSEPWPQYLRQVAQLRSEVPELDEMAWQAARIARTQHLLARPSIFHTALARDEWQDAARANLTHERHQLLHDLPLDPDLPPERHMGPALSPDHSAGGA